MKANVPLALFLVIFAVLVVFVVDKTAHRSFPEGIACPADAMICPDGTALARTGPNCSFPECPLIQGESGEVYQSKDDVTESSGAENDLIILASPQPFDVVESPLTITGKARGYWFFEATFPIVLTASDGRIIAEGYATADGDWMTEDFVPFTGTIDFSAPADNERGTLILKKDNPSGLSEYDDALEIPIQYFINEQPSV